MRDELDVYDCLARLYRKNRRETSQNFEESLGVAVFEAF